LGADIGAAGARGASATARTRRLAAVALSAVSVVLAAAPAVASSPTPEAALANLNAWRATAGVPPIATLDPLLGEGCRLHNAYLAQNRDVQGLDQHHEARARPGYTDLGAQAGASSNLASPGGMSPRRAWSGAVYHRMSLLDPRMTTTWFDSSSGFSCMGVGASTEVSAPGFTLYPWPANGMQDVPLAFRGEYPSPYDMVPGVEQLGYLLSVNVNGPWTAEHSVRGSFLQAVSLTPDRGAPMPVTGIDASSAVSGYLRRGFAIFPHRPLDHGQWYTAHAAGYIEQPTGTWDPAGQPIVARHPFDLTWRFRSIQAGADSELRIARDRLELSSGNPNPATVTVLRAQSGEEVARRTMTSGQSWRPRPPVGEYRVCWSQPETDAVKGVDRCRPWSRMTLTGKLLKGRARLSIAVPPTGLRRAVALSVEVNDPTCCWRKGRHERTRVRSSKTLTLDVAPAVKEIVVRARTSRQTVNGARFGVARAMVRLRRR
jgi:hypothetical protein